MTVWRINKWEMTFERAESRKLKNLHWISLPISFESSGFHALLDEFGDDAAAIYGAWCALCAIAARCDVRGVLANSRGNPLKLSHVARESGFVVKLFERLIEWASRDEVGWLKPISEDELATMIKKNNENIDFGVSPEDSPEHPPKRRGKSRATEQNRTEQDITSPNINQTINQDVPPGIPPTTAGISIDEWVDRWMKMPKDFHERVTEVANRFMRLKHYVLDQLDREFIWQMAWIGCDLDRATVDELAMRLASGDIRKPRSYCEKAMRQMVGERLPMATWSLLRSRVPAAPPPPPKKVIISD